MADDRTALVGEFCDSAETGRAIEGVAALHQTRVGGAQIVLVGAMLAVEEADLDETIAGRLAHRGRPHWLDDRQNVDAGRRSGGGLVEGVEIEHGQLPLALERAQVSNRHPVVFR